MKQTFQMTLMVSFLLTYNLSFAQCPDEADISSNGKCLFMTWTTPPSPIPGSLMEGTDTYTFNSGANPAEYQITPISGNCNGGGTPNDYNGTIVIDGNTCTYVAGTLVGGALPVTLTSFEATLTPFEILLKWETASEEQNAGFDIEKSKNGIDWKSIGWQEGNGTTNLLNQYTYSDFSPFSGINYYRLKQVDFDGGFEDSHVVSVDFSDRNNDGSVIAPNPAGTSFELRNIEIESVKNITLTDHVGRVIQANLDGTQPISVSHLSDGFYFVVIEFENSRKTIKKLNVLK